MKRFLAFFLIIVMFFSLTACGISDVLDIADEVLEGIEDDDYYDDGNSDYYIEEITDEPSEPGKPDEPEPVTEDITTDEPERSDTGASQESETEESPLDEPSQETETEPEELKEPDEPTEPEKILDEHGTYDSKDEVALFIHTYGRLPDNYITKKEAQKMGWSGGSLEKFAKGKCIGGSHFGNYEGYLPEKEGRIYTECDIGTLGKKSRGAERIIFSNDGLIYYTGDHYETFTLLYGEEN